MMREEDIALYTKPDKPTRTRRKNLEGFIYSSSKASVGMFDEERFQCLVDQMSTPELQAFWFYFSASCSLNVANNSAPYWQTRKQQKAFLRSVQNLSYYNLKEDENGSSFVDRNDFITHIKQHIIEFITHKQESNAAYSKLPLLVRLHDKLLFVFIIVLVVTIPVAAVSKHFEILMSIIWFGIVFIFPLFILVSRFFTKKQRLECFVY